MEQRAQDPAPSKGKPPQRGQSDGITPQVLENAVSESRPVDDQTEATDNLSGRPSVVSWNGGFEGPEIFVQGPEGNTRLANDGDFGRRFRTTSNAENSEGVSSVVSVHDLGLGAAPTSPENSFVELAFDRVPGTNFEHLVREKIEQSLRVSKLDNREYLPIDAFEAIFSAKTVDLLMKVTYPELAAEEVCGISRHIMGKEAIQTYRRILGTLVLVKKVSYIKKFLDEEGISDNELPIKRDHSNINIFMARNNTENKTLFRGWERNDIELFYVYQRMLFVPFFNIQQDKLCSYKFDSEIRLPWQYYKPQTSGGNGLVHRVEIHPKHLYFQSANVKPQPKDPHDIEIGEPSERPVYFALKEIFTLDREAYDQELWALQKSFFQKENEKHLVKLLLTFRHGERCYLLFEWADGNLEDFWEGHNRTSIVSDTWAVKQCLGIATAIKRIHGFTTWQKNQRKLAIESGNEEERDWGRHGDIKPRNILWFSSYGEDHHHFVVSDLGLTRFHSRYTRSQVPRSNLDGCTYGYRPPEMDLHNVISQSYDIWSLGCVYMELCLWYVGGIEAVRKFEVEREGQDESEIHGVQEDKYFNVRGKDGQRRAVLKPVVESYLEKLLEVQECTPFVREMLNLIREGMLEVDVKKRLKIDRVCAEIQRIKESVAKDEEAERSPDLILRCSLEAERSDIRGEARRSIELDASRRDIHFRHAQGGCGSELGDLTNTLPRQSAVSIRAESGDSDDKQDTRTRVEVNPMKDHPVSMQELPPDDAESRRMRRTMTPKASESTRTTRQTQSTATQTTHEALGHPDLYAPSSVITVPDREVMQPPMRIRKLDIEMEESKEEKLKLSPTTTSAPRIIIVEDRPGDTRFYRNRRRQQWIRRLRERWVQQWSNLKGRTYQYAQKTRKSPQAY